MDDYEKIQMMFRLSVDLLSRGKHVSVSGDIVKHCNTSYTGVNRIHCIKGKLFPKLLRKKPSRESF